MEKTKRKTDEELVVASQSGNQKATEELLLRHSALVRSLSRGYYLVGGETEDLMQEGMIGLYGAITDYKAGKEHKTFKNFAYLCVRRKMIDALKKSTTQKNKALNESLSSDYAQFFPYVGLDPDENLILSDENREFKKKMSAVLSDFEFKIMWMYMEGLPRAEICESTGKSQKSVDNAIERAKKKLQQLLKK